MDKVDVIASLGSLYQGWLSKISGGWVQARTNPDPSNYALVFVASKNPEGGYSTGGRFVCSEVGPGLFSLK